MKITLTTGFICCMLAYASAQSPFNYGQDKQVYFIPQELRSKLNIQTIYSVDKPANPSENSMGGTWDVTLITFDTDAISDDWYPVWRSNKFKYNFDSLIMDMRFRNGTRYEFSNSQLIAHGGGGYGSFDWNDITRLSDTVSIIETSCAGHCGGQPSNYSKCVFNQKGQLVYIVRYPTPNEEEEEETMEEDEEGEEMTLQDYDTFFMENVNSDTRPDTFCFTYDSRGLLLNMGKGDSETNGGALNVLFPETRDESAYKFHQCYIGRMRMERFIQQKLGFTPELVLVEIYRYGVFSFRLNPRDHKYYKSRTVILEE